MDCFGLAWPLAAARPMKARKRIEYVNGERIIVVRVVTAPDYTRRLLPDRKPVEIGHGSGGPVRVHDDANDLLTGRKCDAGLRDGLPHAPAAGRRHDDRTGLVDA